MVIFRFPFHIFILLAILCSFAFKDSYPSYGQEVSLTCTSSIIWKCIEMTWRREGWGMMCKGQIKFWKGDNPRKVEIPISLPCRFKFTGSEIWMQDLSCNDTPVKPTELSGKPRAYLNCTAVSFKRVDGTASDRTLGNIMRISHSKQYDWVGSSTLYPWGCSHRLSMQVPLRFFSINQVKHTNLRISKTDTIKIFDFPGRLTDPLDFLKL